MTYDNIFEAYYNLYRAEATTPSSTDAEYTIGLRLANEAINRWQNYDGTMWNELYANLQSASTGTKTITTGTKTYIAPTNMQSAGGFAWVTNSDGNTVQTYPIVDPEDVQFKSDTATYCYFTGNRNSGFTLHLNPAPPSSLSGLNLDYIYYKQATLLTTGTDKPEMSDPYFIVNRMLAQRFRASRNPYYQSALRDAEDSLRTMQLANNVGTWANPATVKDRSGSIFGG